MPGVTVDGTDPLAVYDVVGKAIERARSGGGPTLVESKVYRLSAHGNIIAPPGVPLHYPEHEAIAVFGKREEYEAALRGDPVPRFRGKLVQDGTLSSAKADELVEAGGRRNAGRRHIRARRARSRRTSRPSTTTSPENHEELLSWQIFLSLPRSTKAFTRRWQRDSSVLYFGQNLATTRITSSSSATGMTACA